MSDIFAGETVIPMPPLSMPAVEQLAEGILAELSPEALEQPVQLDLLEWADTKLARSGIHVAPEQSRKVDPHEGLGDDRRVGTKPSGQLQRGAKRESDETCRYS
jgi:hypothetical protein